MTSTALFVQSDQTTSLVQRIMRASCSREEWDTPRWRQEAIDKAWAAGVEAVRSTGHLVLVTPSPVTLFYDSLGRIWCADIRLGPNQPLRLIYPDGKAMPIAPAIKGAMTRRTTYAHWAEGPLPHVEIMSEVAELSAEDRRAVEMMPNAALRERARLALMSSPEAQSSPDMREIVDFRIRGIFARPDPTFFVSKQTDREEGSKLLLGDGQMWDGRDGERAPDELL